MTVRSRGRRDGLPTPFLREMIVRKDHAVDFDRYPFSIPAVRHLDGLPFDPKVTVFVGENGSGKSTIIEAIAVLAGFNPEGGSRNFRFTTRASESDLYRALRLVRGTRRERTGYFLRAESFFNVATKIERMDAEPACGPPVIDSYGSRSLHEQSHGESFLSLIRHRFGPDGLYVLDEPEAALSPKGQLVLLARMHQLAETGRCQFVIATHSPFVMAYPNATVYQLTASGIERVAVEETDHFVLTREFLLHRDRFFKHLFGSIGERENP